MNARDFAADLAALACFHDPEDRRASRILAAVVLGWSQLKAKEDPTLFIDGGALVIGGEHVTLLPAWRESLRFVEAALKAHGCGGVRVTGFADRNTVLALLRSLRSSVAPGSVSDLVRTFERNGGAAMEFVAPLSAAPFAERATWETWRALLHGADRAAALQSLIERMEQDPDPFARAVATLPGRPLHPAAGVAGRALLLGRHLGLARGPLLDLGIAAFELEAPGHAPPRRVDRTYARTLLAGRALRRDEKPHIFARILSVARELDLAIRADGPRRLTPHAAVARLQADAGRKLDPLLVAALVGAVGVWPIGTTVLLSGGEVAVVYALAAHAGQVSRPTIRMVIDRQGVRCQNGETIDLSLLAWSRTQIVASLDPEAVGIRLDRVLAP